MIAVAITTDPIFFPIFLIVFLKKKKRFKDLKVVSTFLTYETYFYTFNISNVVNEGRLYTYA